MIILSVNAVLQGQGYTRPETDALLTTKTPVYGLGKNLLRNWYFIGGGSQQSANPFAFPINTRGQTTISTGGTYFIDGWRTRNVTGGTVTFNNNGNGISITSDSQANALIQYIDNPSILIGKIVTISVLTNNNLYYATTSTAISIPANQTTSAVTAITSSGQMNLNISTAGVIWVDIRANANSTEIFKAVKLELGTQQTLAHNEGTEGTPIWVFNETPNFNEELIKCKISQADSEDKYASSGWWNYGIGSQLKDQIEYSNCNTGLTTTGALPPFSGYFNIGTTASNRPDSITSNMTAVIEQVIRGDSYQYQKYYDYNTNKIYERFANDGTFGDWESQIMTLYSGDPTELTVGGSSITFTKSYKNYSFLALFILIDSASTTSGNAGNRVKCLIPVPMLSAGIRNPIFTTTNPNNAVDQLVVSDPKIVVFAGDSTNYNTLTLTQKSANINHVYLYRVYGIK